jgi:hypothetical protein
MVIPKELNNEIWDYCRANNITAIDDFTVKLIKQGFTVEKYVATPVANEKIIEKIVEVPVEKIIEKEVYITNDEEVITLGKKINDLTNELNDVKNQLELEKKKKKDIYGEG